MFKSIAITAFSLAVLSAASHAQTPNSAKTTTLPPALVQPHASKALSPADTITIHEVLARVYLAEDSRNLEALRQLVTSDLTHDHSIFGRVTGPEGIVSLVRDHPERFDGLRHVALNIATRATGENHAEAVSYILVMQLHGTEEAGLPRILGTGVVRDRLVKQDGRWRIAWRVYDQFALSEAVIPDAATRSNAARILPINRDPQ